ncbi:UDP-glucose 4-epimerase GalE [Denitromonas iodatirespirans]|uniref:UDP-glucose 4-epimerase n=1 Tax=Denitromonas iodatirespirans TaxID=2795389 RepID=A0A944D947_DENI1|nr:UDP-glucose 4-epimerase GalE [Denitromonas iodatirespirans]MBT0960942.1 UDP-glucose 4-epimerase GalE [Denitromonas iodatirespirans]
MACILVTGGAGYIGSHTCVALMAAGHQVVVVDNFSNSKPLALQRVAQIAGRPVAAVHEVDLRDRPGLEAVFGAHRFDAVIHFAGLKAVGESVAKPLAYYDNNVSGTLVLLEVMAAHGLKRMVFSSSATVYGDPASVPIREDFPTAPTNPYGRTKWMLEFILRDVAATDPDWQLALLRYFNPVGAHPSGLIGEDPNGIPNNLMPYVCQVAVGKLAQLSVFGDDYPTADGTGVRDYIHVVDLAVGHVRAVERLIDGAGVLTLNLGTGRGYSVLDVIKAFEQASGRPVPYRVAPRRAGDIAQCYADPAQAQAALDWRAAYDLADMCTDAWRWQSANPEGYGD